jgi:hypothetical protein
MLCIDLDYIRARNGRFHRMYCTPDTDTSLFSGDAQIARTTYSNSCTLSYLFGAILIHNERKPSRVRSDDDSIQISLNSISLRSGLAWTSAARPLLTYAAALLGPPLPGPYLRTYYVDAMNGNRRQWMFRIDPICFFVSVIKIRTGLGFLKGGTE